MKKRFYFTVVCALMSSACARDATSSGYTKADVGEAQLVYPGTIEKAELINLQDKSRGFSENYGAALVGSVGGGIAGYAITGGNALGTTVGAVAGGGAGHALGQQAQIQQAMLYTIKLTTGALMSVTQDLEPRFLPGQKVRLIVGQNKARSRIVSE